MVTAVVNPSFHLRGAVKAPAEIRELQGWLIWRIEVVEGTARKVPYYASRERRNGKNGAPHDRAKLVSFAAAVNAASRHGFDGVGLALLPEFNLTVLDFDKCVHGGTLVPEVGALVADTYAEFSPSGNGVHAIYRGALPDKKSHASDGQWGFETFSSKGFVTFSGNVLDTCAVLGNEDTIAPLPQVVRDEFTRRFGADRRPEGTAPSSERLGLTADEARAWLAKVDADIGYHSWCSVGMALHHEFGDEGFALWDDWSTTGAKYKGTDSLISHWRSFGGPSGAPVTMKTVAKMAGVGHHAPLSPDEFAAKVEEAKADPLPRFTPIPLGEFTRRPPPTWLIKGVLPKASLVVLFGESGAGKSFVALDMVAAIARGVPWRGHKVKQGRVVYIAAEGAGGFRNRCVAYAQGFELDVDALPIEVIADRPNFLTTDDAPAVAAAVGTAAVIVVDTLAQVTPGGNENGSEDMGKALNNCAAIHQATGAVVVLVHHAGKDSSKGARGHTSLRAAADAELEVVSAKGVRYMRTTKQKDGDDTGKWGFSLEVLPIGVDEDDEVITSCVVREAALSTPEGGAPSRRLGAREQPLFDAIQELAAKGAVELSADAIVALALQKYEAKGAKLGKSTRVNFSKTLEAMCGSVVDYVYDKDTGTVSL